MVRCTLRKKEETCIESDECKWVNGKCEYKVKPLKQVICKTRKEKACLEEPDKCIWANNKCSNIDSPVVSPSSVKSTAASSSKPKSEEKSAASGSKSVEKSAASSSKAIKSSAASSSKTKSESTSTSQSSSTTSPPKELKQIKHRHCFYYSNKYDLKHQKKVKLDSVLKEKYDSKYKSETNVHLGQRKLLLSEIQLLTEYYKENKADPTLLYIGAAIGSHLLILHELFPKVKFILYDGAAFDKRLYKLKDTFEIYTGKEGFFTTEICKTLKKKYKPLIFVSDIRLTEEDFEKGVERDMISQKEWIEILKPELSLVKFRMPYSLKHGESLEYIKGDILFGIWPKGTSGETRLLIKKSNISKLKKYDFKQYEELMFFHNKYTRPFCFDLIEKYNKYLNHYCPCYDCISELVTLDNYCQVYSRDLDAIVNIMLTLPAKDFFAKKNKPLQSLDSVLKTKM